MKKLFAKKTAFTLAEVLITLGIIWVVAALTTPGLIANYQKKANDKSLVFRVKDKRLLNLTGGIVQGMSGSPIMQNGKIVGAVTHVFLSDPTKGYGVYTDWMVA